MTDPCRLNVNRMQHSATMTIRDLKNRQKLILFVSAKITILSFVALLVFIAQAVVSLARVPLYWNLCFFLCAASLGGSMLLYAGLLRIGGPSGRESRGNIAASPDHILQLHEILLSESLR
jgi:hypothetical protein